MEKKVMRTAVGWTLCLTMLIASACAAAHSSQPPVDVQARSDEPAVIHSGGMIYIPDRSVYFADVDEKYDWAFQEIDYLANTGIVSGTGNLIFSPSHMLSRADFVLMLYRAYDMEKYIVGDQFSDVPDDAYYADALRAARALGIATGDQDNRFYPNRALTRQDAMVLLKRTLERTNLRFTPGDLSAFSDADEVAAYAAESVAALAKAGVIHGKDNKICPNAQVTRAEMAVMLYRALHLRLVGQQAVYLTQPAARLVCVGSRIYADVLIKPFDEENVYTGLYALKQLTRSESGYQVSLGQAQPIDDDIVWDGTQLYVNNQVLPVAPDCEAIVVEMYSKREAGLCSTGQQYRAGAVSIIDGQVQTVYYKE